MASPQRNSNKRKADDLLDEEKTDKMPKTGHSPPPQRARRGSVGGDAPVTESFLKTMMEGMEKRLGSRMENMGLELKQNQNDIKEVRQLLGDTETKLLERMDTQRRQLEAKIADGTPSTSGTPPSSAVKLPPKKEETYWAFRKSLSIWPIPGDDIGTSLRAFLNDKLKISDEQIKELGKISFKWMKEPAAKARREVLCTFETKEARDIVKAAGRNLAGLGGEVGLRAQFPGFLMDTFRMFESIAYHLRSGDPDIRRAVKYDDSAFDLVMDVKLGNEWKRIRSDEARKTLSENPQLRRGPEEISAGSLSELLSKSREKTPATGANRQPMP